MRHVNNGGPAFPVENDANKQYNWIAKGMTLRDYFAAKAMVSLYISYQGNPPEQEVIADEAYGIADAMLEAREK